MDAPDKMSSVRHTLGLLVAVGLSASAGCRGEDVSFDCENQAANFRDRVLEEQQPLVPVPETGPYPVGLQLSEEGLNRLLASVIDQDVPFGGSVPFGILPQGPADATFEAESDPVIVLEDVPGCPHCVLFSLDFGVQLDTEDEALSSGFGYAKLSIPLFLQGDPASGTTTLVADYSQAKIEDWYMSVFGFDSETHAALGGALRILMEENIAMQYGEVELLDIGSWTIGKDQVRLLARELFVQPDSKKLAIGMASNLVIEETTGVDLTRPMPEEIPMQVLMHSDLFLAMSHQMFAEGEIARRYDEGGRPEEDGAYGVTLEETEASQGNNLTNRFRVWRIAEGYCGWASAEMPIAITVNETMTGIEVTPGSAQLLPEAEGSGRAAQEEKRLVDENQDLIDTFREALTEKVGETLNYAELDLEDSDIVFSTRDVRTDIELQAVVTDLDFFIVAEE